MKKNTRRENLNVPFSPCPLFSPGSYNLTYDIFGEVTQVHEPFGLVLTFAYDADGNRIQAADSLGGLLTSVYDPFGELQSRTLVSPQATERVDLSYTARGQLASAKRSQDAVGTTLLSESSYTYNPDDRVSTIEHQAPNSAVLAGYSLSYDGAGQLTESIDHGQGNLYSYDPAGQLTAATLGATAFNYGTYDPAGNRPMPVYQTQAANELTTDGTWNYYYDPEGNLTEQVNIASGITWQYGYDNANELTSVQQWSGNPSALGSQLELTASYKYDVFGNRLEQDYFEIPLATTQVQRYAYDGWDPATPAGSGTENFSIWADLNATSSLTTRYLRGDAVDQVFARVDLVTTLGGSTFQPFWYLTDQQGSIRDVTNGTGAVVDTVQYDPFGNILSQTNTSKLGRYAWTGRELDVETGLQYNRARYYDSAIGRWITQDPVGFDAGDSNLYRYARNAPTNATDPDGLQQSPVRHGVREGIRQAPWAQPGAMRGPGPANPNQNPNWGQPGPMGPGGNASPPVPSSLTSPGPYAENPGNYSDLDFRRLAATEARQYFFEAAKRAGFGPDQAQRRFDSIQPATDQDEDIRRVYRAANDLLGEKGISPFNVSNTSADQNGRRFLPVPTNPPQRGPYREPNSTALPTRQSMLAASIAAADPDSERFWQPLLERLERAGSEAATQPQPAASGAGARSGRNGAWDRRNARLLIQLAQHASSLAVSLQDAFSRQLAAEDRPGFMSGTTVGIGIAVTPNNQLRVIAALNSDKQSRADEVFAAAVASIRQLASYPIEIATGPFGNVAGAHAEENIITWAGSRRYSLITIGTRPDHCPDCMALLISRQIFPATPTEYRSDVAWRARLEWMYSRIRSTGISVPRPQTATYSRPDGP